MLDTLPADIENALQVTIPLSFSQQRLWFLDRLEGPNTTYNTTIAWRLQGRFDRQILEAALLDMIERHESLRTIFPASHDTPWQKIISPSNAKLTVTQLDVNEEHLSAAMAREASYCFDLSCDIPIRAYLFRLCEEKHALLLLMHHIASDGWSRAPLTRDLSLAYAARCNGLAPDWAPLPIQYADYSLWQRELLGGRSDPKSLYSQQKKYWEKELAALPEQLQLPFDRMRPTVTSHRGANIKLHISAGLQRNLLALAHGSGASLFM